MFRLTQKFNKRRSSTATFSVKRCCGNDWSKKIKCGFRLRPCQNNTSLYFLVWLPPYFIVFYYNWLMIKIYYTWTSSVISQNISRRIWVWISTKSNKSWIFFEKFGSFWKIWYWLFVTGTTARAATVGT